MRTLMQDADCIFKVLRTTDGWIEHHDMVLRACLLNPFATDYDGQAAIVNDAIDQLLHAGHCVERREEPRGVFYRLVVEL